MSLMPDSSDANETLLKRQEVLADFGDFAPSPRTWTPS